MVDLWKASDLKRRLGRKLERCDLISMSRTSVVYGFDFSSRCEEDLAPFGGSCIGKSYVPHRRPEYAEIYDSPSSLAQTSFYRPSSYYCRKEAHLLEFFSDTGLFPKLVALVPDPEIQMVIMERIAHATSYDKLLSGAKDSDKRMLQEALLGHLALFYTKTDQHTRTLASHGSSKKLEAAEKYITVRSFTEEDTRLRHYFYKLMYGNSLEFRSRHPEFYTHFPTDPQKRKRRWQKARYEMVHYLTERGINFDEMVQTFKEQYAELVFGETSASLDNLLHNGKVRIVHGDFGPHNVLRRSDGTPIILDLNECRVAFPHVDISLALFNLYSDPQESDVPRLIYGFWRDQPEVRAAYPQFSDFFLGSVATRLAQGIRIASCNVDYSHQDVHRFVECHPDYEDLELEEQLRKFKHDRIKDIHRLINFYTAGEGYNVVLAGIPRRESLKTFLTSIRELLHEVQIGESPVESYRGPSLISLESAVA